MEVPTTPSGSDLDALVARFEASVIASATPLGEATALVRREAIVEIARWLRDERGYQLLVSLTAVDFLTAVPRFQVVYHLRALPAEVVAGEYRPDAAAPARLLRLKVPVDERDAVVPTLTGVYPTANFHERETYDMFGIEFAGHPDLRRILMPDNYEGFPLRKDFPLIYEEVAFSFNEAEVHGQKPKATG